MKRYVSLEEISDGKIYKAGDMVKTDCLGCKDCSRCCHGMGESVVLDPYDVWRLQAGLGKNLQELMAEDRIGLNVVDGVVLPYLKMSGSNEACSFLDNNGRCSIHAHRPGICRLFPLGRYYEENNFRYFLQNRECDHPKAKIKVEKWLDTPELVKYEAFINQWHSLLMHVEELLEENQEENFGKNMNLFLLKTFFLAPYDEQKNFYEQYAARSASFGEIVY